MTMTTCGLCETPIDDGGYLCLGCTKATRVRLECLPALYDGLAAMLAPAGGAGQGRGSRPVYAPLPVREDVLDLRADGGMVAALENWVVVIRQDRGHRAGGQPEGRIEGRLTAAVAELIGHLPWVAVSWPDAGVFATDIRKLAADAASIIDPPERPVRGQRIGSCPAEHDDGTLCGAVLRLLPGERVVTCGWCRTTYPPACWPGLKVLMDADALRITPSL